MLVRRTGTSETLAPLPSVLQSNRDLSRRRPRFTRGVVALGFGLAAAVLFMGMGAWALPLAAAACSDNDGGCADERKRCGDLCVSRLDPAFGCDDVACSPCSVDHGTATCGATPPLGSSFKQLSAGDNCTCAIKSDGAISCWGFNGSGQAKPPAGTFW